MISAIVTFLYTLALLVASFFYLKARYRLCENDSLKVVIKKNWKYMTLTIIVFLGVLTVETIYALKQDGYSLPVLMKWSTLFWGVYLLAKVDYHEKKIPNKIILAMLIIRMVFLAHEVCTNLEYWKKIVGYPLLGAAISGMIMAVAMLLSRKGVGMGDVKMFIVIGAFVGSSQILPTMFYSFLCSAIGGICLLVTKKAGIKDSIPMAPFACAGIALEYLLLMMGG